MRILELELENNDFFGTCVFDFSIAPQIAADCILIAGENGTGKTKLLNLIYDLTTSGVQGIVSNEKRIWTFLLNNEEISIIRDFSKNMFDATILTILFDYSIPAGHWNRMTIHAKNTESKELKIPSEEFLIPKRQFSHLLRSIFSSVEINFSTNKISSVTTQEIDLPVDKSIKADPQLGTSIKQLLVDVKNSDAIELNDWVNDNPGVLPPEDVINKRMKRFQNAFNSIFSHLHLKTIISTDNSKEVVFEKHGEEILLDSLSSGEKQIVFRGAFLLRNRNSINETFVLIDEPEISLHPEWQKRILSFYKKLFMNDSGKQSSQIFIATHSPFILHDPSRFNDKVIVLTEEEQRCGISQENVFYISDYKEIIERAFNVTEFDFEKPVVFVEGETDPLYLNKCREIYGYDLEKFDIKWIGLRRKDNTTRNTGDTALNHCYNFLSAHNNFVKNKIILLYDSDTKKPPSDEGKIFVRIMHENTKNTVFKRGIENLICIDDVDCREFYSVKDDVGQYGEKKSIETFMKVKFCDYICHNATKDNNFLIELKKVIDEIENLIS